MYATGQQRRGRSLPLPRAAERRLALPIPVADLCHLPPSRLSASDSLIVIQAEELQDALLTLPKPATLSFITPRAVAPSRSTITAPTPLMIVSAPAATLLLLLLLLRLLLLASAVVASAAEALAVRPVGSVAVLATCAAAAAATSGAAHPIAAAAVEAAMTLEVVRVATIATAHLRVLRRWQAALASRRVVCGRSRSCASKRRRGPRCGLGFAERLQVVVGGPSSGLSLTAELLALGLVRRPTTSKIVMRAAKAAGPKAGLRASLARASSAVFTQARSQSAVSVKRRLAAERTRR